MILANCAHGKCANAVFCEQRTAFCDFAEKFRGVFLVRATMNPNRPALTLRSVAFSLLGILLMSGLAGYHDNIRQVGPLMIGNHLPGGAVAYLVFVGLVWNGLAGRLSRRLVLSQKELAVVLCATFVACYPPTSGLFRYFQRVVLFPWYHLPGRPAWAKFGLLGHIRPELFPSPCPATGIPAPGDADFVAYQTVYQGFFLGLGKDGHAVAFSSIPFGAWLRPLAFWGPLVFLLVLVLVSMTFVVHRQWAGHEQLSYPIAQVVSGLCHRDDGAPGVPDIFRQRLFWWGFVPVTLLYFLDFLATKYPGILPRTTEFLPDFRGWWLPFDAIFPGILRSPNWWQVCWQNLYFTIVGVAFFTSAEVSFTMGVSSIAIVLFGLAFYQVTGTPVTSGELANLRAGAYVGYTAILLYTGRAYFRAIFAHAFGVRGGGGASLRPEDAAAVLGARVLVLAYAGVLVLLHAMGEDWAPAVLYTLCLLMLYLVFTRIICETGIPFLNPDWNPNDLLFSLFGFSPFGPKNLVLMPWIHNAVAYEPRECLMPYVATAAKVADENAMRPRRLFFFALASIALALVVGFVSTTYIQYNEGGMRTDPSAAKDPIVKTFNTCARHFQEMSDIGILEKASEGTFFSRLSLAHGNPVRSRAFLFGIALVVLCSVTRFKFSRFPIHPVLFLVWGSWAPSKTWGSFLLGWFVKTLVVRMGGGGAYQRAKPLFVGMIAAECVFVGFHVAYTLVYHALFEMAPSVGIFVLPQ